MHSFRLNWPIERPNITLLISTLALSGFLAGCNRTDEYQAAAGLSGEQVFNQACANCHQFDEQGKLFKLDEQINTVSRVARVIREGNLLMPAFPNIPDQELNAVSLYVLNNSQGL